MGENENEGNWERKKEKNIKREWKRKEPAKEMRKEKRNNKEKVIKGLGEKGKIKLKES